MKVKVNIINTWCILVTLCRLTDLTEIWLATDTHTHTHYLASLSLYGFENKQKQQQAQLEI